MDRLFHFEDRRALAQPTRSIAKMESLEKAMMPLVQKEWSWIEGIKKARSLEPETAWPPLE